MAKTSYKTGRDVRRCREEYEERIECLRVIRVYLADCPEAFNQEIFVSSGVLCYRDLLEISVEKLQVIILDLQTENEMFETAN
jgi:hypothetical protein